MEPNEVKRRLQELIETNGSGWPTVLKQLQLVLEQIPIILDAQGEYIYADKEEIRKRLKVVAGLVCQAAEQARQLDQRKIKYSAHIPQSSMRSITLMPYLCGYCQRIDNLIPDAETYFCLKCRKRKPLHKDCCEKHNFIAHRGKATFKLRPQQTTLRQ